MLDAMATRPTPALPAASSATNVASTFVLKTSSGVPSNGVGIAARWISPSALARVHDGRHAGRVADLALRPVRAVAGQLGRRRDPVQRMDLVPVGEQVGHHVSPDPAGRTGDHDPHQSRPPMSRASSNPCM